MANPGSGRIGEQHDAYRRGLVLGLTMAEVGILIIFVLLLLIAFEELARERLVRGFQGMLAVTPQRLRELQSEEHTMKGMVEELGVGPESTDDLPRRLVRMLQTLSSSGAALSALAEAKEEIAKLRAVGDALRKALADVGSNGPDAAVDRLQEQELKIADQEGQLKRYERRLSEEGRGKGERPCWVKPDGTIDYLYDVVLTSGGIRMREYVLPHRAVQRAKLPMPAVDSKETLAPAEFLRRTRPLFDRGLAENCRFFTVIYDGTASNEKALYKSLLRTVEGHFYKRLDDGPAPF
jgi:hypothetical protein